MPEVTEADVKRVEASAEQYRARIDDLTRLLLAAQVDRNELTLRVEKLERILTDGNNVASARRGIVADLRLLIEGAEA